ncbi:MAG TPA: hypothetical protein DCE83_08345 [Enterococcus sp.]|nr:hypothetical protein [Enterococcus sp.]
MFIGVGSAPAFFVHVFVRVFLWINEPLSGIKETFKKRAMQQKIAAERLRGRDKARLLFTKNSVIVCSD